MNFKDPFPELTRLYELLAGISDTRNNTIDEARALKNSRRYTDEEIDRLMIWARNTSSSIKDSVRMFEHLSSFSNLKYIDDEEKAYNDSWNIMNCIENICITEKCPYPTAYRMLIKKFGFDELEEAKLVTLLARETKTRLKDALDIYDNQGLEYIEKYLEPIIKSNESDNLKTTSVLFEKRINKIPKKFSEKYGIEPREFALLAFIARTNISQAMKIYGILADKYEKEFKIESASVKNERVNALWKLMCKTVALIPGSTLTDIMLIYTSCIRINPNYKKDIRLRNMDITLMFSGIARVTDILDSLVEKEPDTNISKSLNKAYSINYIQENLDKSEIGANKPDDFTSTNDAEKDLSPEEIEMMKGISRGLKEFLIDDATTKFTPNFESISRADIIKKELWKFVYSYLEKNAYKKPEEIKEFIDRIIYIDPDLKDEYLEMTGKSVEDLTPLDYYTIAVGSVKEKSIYMFEGLDSEPFSLLDFYKFVREKVNKLKLEALLPDEGDIFEEKKPPRLRKDIFKLLAEFYIKGLNKENDDNKENNDNKKENAGPKLPKKTIEEKGKKKEKRKGGKASIDSKDIPKNRNNTDDFQDNQQDKKIKYNPNNFTIGGRRPGGAEL